MSKIGGFISKLTEGKGVCTDPFDDDFFDVAEHIKRREDEETAIVEQAIEAAKRRGERVEREREQAKHRETVIERRR